MVPLVGHRDGGIEDWRFEASVFVGDTLRVPMDIRDCRVTSPGEMGIVQRHFALLNQDDLRVQSGLTPMMIRGRPQPST